MYKKNKTIFIFLALLALSVISVRFIKTYQNEMFGGYQEVIAVNQSTLDMQKDMANLAKQYRVVIAKQIVVMPKSKTGKLKNTYQKIGIGRLPKSLPEQTNQAIIKKSPDTVIYVIVGKGLTAQKLATKLNHLGNTTNAFNTNQQIIILKQLILVPQTLLVIIVLLFTFMSLLVADYVSAFKKISIHRLSGESTSQFVLKNIWYDFKNVLMAVMVSSVAALIYLVINDILSLLYIEILLITLLFFAGILTLTIIFVSIMIFVVIKQQPINLLIKGKMPIRSITVFIVLLQILSIIITVFSVAAISSVTSQLKILNKGQNEWARNTQYYGLTMLQGEASPENWQAFLAELLADPNNMLVANQFDNIYLSEHGKNGKTAQKQANSYYPTPFSDANLLIVSESFLRKEKIKISTQLKQNLATLSKGQYGLLIPKSQEKSIARLKKAWGDFYEPPKETQSPGFEAKQFSGVYTTTNPAIFAYPVYGVTHFLADQFYAKDPLIMVYSSETVEKKDIGMLTQYIYQILVTDVEKTKRIIKKYHLELTIGSFVNGYAATNQRLKTVQTQQVFLIGSTILALVSSMLLTYLINMIYLYQNRRKFTIERLSGMPSYQIYKLYLLIVLISMMSLEMTLFALKFSPLSFCIPILYASLIGVVFKWQLKQAKLAQIQYLKGE